MRTPARRHSTNATPITPFEASMTEVLFSYSVATTTTKLSGETTMGVPFEEAMLSEERTWL